MPSLSRENLENRLKHPFIDELNNNTLKLKRNLNLISFFILFMHLTETGVGNQTGMLHIAPLGLNINIQEGHFYLTLLIVFIYQFIFYVWEIFNFYCKTRLRFTGSELKPITAAILGDGIKDYPENPKDSTLYYYLFSTYIKAIKSNIDNVMDGIRKNEMKNAPVKFIEGEIDTITRKIEDFHKDPRIEVSLQRFDKFFRHFQKSDSYLFIFINIFIPFGLSFFVFVFKRDIFYSLCCSIFSFFRIQGKVLLDHIGF